MLMVILSMMHIASGSHTRASFSLRECPHLLSMVYSLHIVDLALFSFLVLLRGSRLCSRCVQVWGCGSSFSFSDRRFKNLVRGIYEPSNIAPTRALFSKQRWWFLCFQIWDYAIVLASIEQSKRNIGSRLSSKIGRITKESVQRMIRHTVSA